MGKEKIELIRIDFKKENDVKSGVAKNGKQWKMYPVSIKSGDVWYSGSFFKEEEITKFRSLSIDKSIYLKVWEEEYNGKTYNKFKFLDKSDQLEIRIKRLEEFMSLVLEENQELKEKLNQNK